MGGGRGPGLRPWDTVLGFRAGAKVKGQDVAAAFIPVGCWQKLKTENLKNSENLKT